MNDEQPWYYKDYIDAIAYDTGYLKKKMSNN